MTYTYSPNDVTVFAETNFRNQRRRFGIKIDDRRRHMYLIGKTGMGKSTLMENMVIDDIIKNRGMAVVDPHGDLIEKILKTIPKERINDVIYFNPSDTKFPIAFNILENVDPEYKHLIAYGLVGVFKKIWADSWGPRMEYILTNTILALLEYPGSTLLGIMRMLVDKKYRKKVVSKVTDPVVKTFWTDEYANYSEKFRTEAIAPIQNKVGQFLASSIIRNIVGQSKSTIEMREAIDDGKIILMNLSKGRIGEENSALLGAMMITKIQLAAMSRVNIPEEERRDFFLYVDEFQNFSTESFANILSEARKYRLNLIMAHQYIEQLSDEVKAAVFGNVGTFVCFRIGATDAEELEKEFEPQFTAQNLVNIPKYNFYCKLMIDGIASDPFSAIGLAPYPVVEEENMDIVIKVSRERYARPKKIVEERILKWSGVEVAQAPEEKSEQESEQESEEINTDLVADETSQIVNEQQEVVQEQARPSFSAPSFIKSEHLQPDTYQLEQPAQPQPEPELESQLQPQIQVELAPEEPEVPIQVKSKPDSEPEKVELRQQRPHEQDQAQSAEQQANRKKKKKRRKKKRTDTGFSPDKLPDDAKPVAPSIAQAQETASLKDLTNKTISFTGNNQNQSQNNHNKKQDRQHNQPNQQKKSPNLVPQQQPSKPPKVEKIPDDSEENKVSLSDIFN